MEQSKKDKEDMNIIESYLNLTSDGVDELTQKDKDQKDSSIETLAKADPEKHSELESKDTEKKDDLKGDIVQQ